MVDAFFLEVQRDHRKNALTLDPAKGKTKSSIFYRTVEMKQPHTLTEPFLMKCVGKGVWRISPSFPVMPPSLSRCLKRAQRAGKASSRLCHRKWLVIFSWNSKGITNRAFSCWKGSSGCGKQTVAAKAQAQCVCAVQCRSERVLNVKMVKSWAVS